MSLALEALIVGAFLAVVLALVASFVPLTTPWVTLATGFAIGVATHLFFEITGLNAKYCAIGHACTSS